MKLIPVIDLMGGEVVHARRGERSRYRPLDSKLVKGSDVEDVAHALLHFYPFDTLYVADLDAISGTGSHSAAIAKLAARFPALELWVDRGVSGHPLSEGRIRRVEGSESLSGLLALSPGSILSLDFDGDKLRGPDSVFSSPQLWPEDVIVMSLERVGSGLGPNLGHIERIKKLAPEKRWYAAGGVRNLGDLYALERIGVCGALIASALHEGKISAAELGSAFPVA